MEVLSIRYCRICGSDMAQEEDICVKCGGVQIGRHKKPSTGLLILLLVSGFILVVMLGIVSAISIPRLSAARACDCNAVALRNAAGVKKAAESFFSRNGVYPDTVAQLDFKADEGVSVNLVKTGERSCTLVVAHVDGSGEFVACPGDERIFFRARSHPGDGFVPVR